MPTDPKNPNEGEGSRSGARQYDDGATRHAKAGESDRAARQAARDLDDPATRKDLEKAESTGRSKAKEEDRLLRDDSSSKPSGNRGESKP
jgi:hypothetical protein